MKIILEHIEQRVEIRIQDTGIGMSQQVLAQLGKEGFSHGKPDGSGLGVSNAKKWIESWHGTLAIESRIDQGTQVTISLPLNFK